MLLAGVDATGAGGTDQLLQAVSEHLAGKGIQLLGALRIRDPDPIGEYCETTLRLLPSGPDIRITQDLGAGSTACRMDAAAIEQVVGMATTRLSEQRCDIVLVNKFGVSEAEGRGFRSLIADALGRGIPVLTGISATHRPAFDRFSEGMARILPPTQSAVLDWCEQATEKTTRLGKQPVRRVWNKENEPSKY